MMAQKKYNTWWISQDAGFREDSPKMVDLDFPEIFSRFLKIPVDQ